MRTKDSVLFLTTSGNDSLVELVKTKTSYSAERIESRVSEAGEYFLTVNSDLAERRIVLLYMAPKLDLLELHSIVSECRAGRALHICLVLPYLFYKQLGQGQHDNHRAKMQKHFSSFLTANVDSIITASLDTTIRHHLETSYEIPWRLVPLLNRVGDWIKWNVTSPILIFGNQGSQNIVQRLQSSFGFVSVHSSFFLSAEESEIRSMLKLTPVIIESEAIFTDELSLAVQALLRHGFPAPIYLCGHGYFEKYSYEQILATGVAEIVTTNAVNHRSNDIDISGILAGAIEKHLQSSSSQKANGRLLQ